MTEDLIERMLAAPRGRRVCLEYVGAVAPELGLMLFWLSYVAAPQGSTLIRFGDAGEDPSYTPEQLAAGIRSVEFTVPDDGAVHAALRMSVDVARYWQEPDGGDVLAGHPAVWAALRGAAAAVLSSRLAESWESPRTAEQGAVEWRDEAEPPVSAADTLERWHRDLRDDEQRSARDRPLDIDAGFSGSWWSIPLGVLQTRGRVIDALELVEDLFNFESATATPVRGSGTTWEINTPDDWAELCRLYPIEVTASRRHDWYRVTGRDGRWLIPDWQRVAAEWDAVHLSTIGYLSAATMLIPVDEEYASVIGGWAPDSTLWLTDGDPEFGVAQQWTRESPAEEWVRSNV